jgi:hypothetical protein
MPVRECLPHHEEIVYRSLGRSMLAVTCAWGAVLLVTASALARGPAPAISPAPGTPDVSPQTQISVLGVPRAEISSVSVTGAVSGAHPGTLRAYSGDRGASFVLRQPLTQGEQVRAVVALRGRPAVRFSFGVARLGPTPPILNITTTQPAKLDRFMTLPTLTPPRVTVLRPSATPGDVFLTPLPTPIVHPGSVNTIGLSPVGPGGPMIVDGAGRLVWFKQLTPPTVAANLRIQRYAGHPVLTWWQGPVTFVAFGLGEGVIADTRYRTIATVHAGNGYAMDLHEFTLTPDGDALFTVYSPVLIHLAGTPAGTTTALLDAIVQEVDVRTGLVTWEWHGLGHIPLADSYATPANSASYDAFHFNALQALSDNRVLVSARDTSAVYEVDRVGGRIQWTLGGKASTFRLGPGARFYFQHDAEMLSGGRVSMFDDEAGPPQKGPFSRGLVLRLDRHRHTATVSGSYHRSNVTSAQSEGSVQSLAGGNTFVGFGSSGFFSQFSATGKLLFDARLPQDDGSYRDYRYAWSATPATLPVAVAQRTGLTTVSVFASWNGATGVARWQVLAGADAASLAPVATVARTDFETQADVTTPATMFAVRALDASGHALATSPAVPAS